LELAEELHPDFITLDVQMPDMSRWSVLTALKENPTLAEIPVIMLTMVDDQALGYVLGASDYLTKPISVERLVAVFQKFQSRQSCGPVLVVEDDANSRDLLHSLLERRGWQVQQAENGRRALEFMQIATPSLILLDLMMPEMNGFDFIQAVRSYPEWQFILVLVTTAKDLTTTDRQWLSEQVQGFSQKRGLDSQALLSEIEELMELASL